jgi:spore germination protein YaaH
MRRSRMNTRKPPAPRRSRRLGAHASLGLASSLLWMVLMPAASVAAVAPQVEPGSVTLTATTITSTVGGHVAFKATASDPGGTAEYQWWVEEPTGSWVQEQGYSTSDTFTLSTPSAGDYLVAVEVMDQKQVAAADWSQAQTTLPRGVFVNSVVSAGVVSGETAGRPVTLTAAAANIYEPLYQFWVETPQGEWMQSGNYSSATTFTFTPATPGSYRWVAYAKSPLAANNPTGALMSSVQSAAVLGAAAGVTVSAASPTFTANGTGTDRVSVVVTSASGQDLSQFSGQVTLSATGDLFDGGTATTATVAIAKGSGTVVLSAPSSAAGTYVITAENLTAVGGVGVAPQVTYGQATVTGLYPMISVGWGYFYPGNAYGGYYDLTHNAAGLTAIAPDWYELNVTASGTVGIPAFSTYPPASMINQVRATASANHVMMWPSVGWYGGGSLDVLRSPANVSAIVSAMVQLAVSSGYQGMTIDFEGMGSPSATTSADPTPAYQVFDNFVAALSSGLHAAGKTLMVAVYPAAYPYTIYDYAALAKSADYLNVMGYPEYNTGYPSGADPYPGPTAGYPWIESLLSGDLTTGVNPHQIILGLAPYGHGWTYTTSGYVCGQTGYPDCQGYISNYGAQALIAASSGTIVPVWDPWQKEEVFTAGPAAVAPPSGLSSATTAAGPSDAVRSLQNLLNYVLIREAVQSGQAEPPLLITDGYYGPITTSAVALLQKDLDVATTSATAGVYDAATQAALAALIQQWHIGSTVYWTETSRSTTDKMKLAIADRLGGVAMWRLGFETAHFWSGMATMAAAVKEGSG